MIDPVTLSSCDGHGTLGGENDFIDSGNTPTAASRTERIQTTLKDDTIMNSIKALFATLTIAAAISPALAATDGLPPNLQEKGVGQSVQIEAMTARSAPQFLHGLGEVSLVSNPAFNATPAAAPVRMGRITPIRNYVGA